MFEAGNPYQIHVPGKVKFELDQNNNNCKWKNLSIDLA